MQDLDPSDICKEKILNPQKRIRVIIRTPTTDGRTDGRTDRQTDGRTGWIQYTPPKLRFGGYKNTQDCQKLKFYQIQINSNINQCFPKQFWCWSWRNGLVCSNIPFFVAYWKSPQGITQSCTSLSQPPTAMPQPCPSGWAGGSAGWDYVTVLAELSSSCWHSI